MLALRSKRIGMTIDQSGIRYATLRKKKGWELEKSGFYPFPPGLIVQDGIVNEESLRISIRQWAKQEGLQGSTAVLAVPTSQVIVRRMSIPAVNDKELRQLIHLEVETAMHLPFEQPVHDFVAVGRDEESTQVLVYAAPRSWIDPLVGMLRDARIRVTGTGLAATAIEAAVHPHQEEPANELMHVHLREKSVEIAMFHGGNPVFVRSIEEDGAEEGISCYSYWRADSGDFQDAELLPVRYPRRPVPHRQSRCIWFLAGGTASAGRAAPSTSRSGIQLSWPQCCRSRLRA